VTADWRAAVEASEGGDPKEQAGSDVGAGHQQLEVRSERVVPDPLNGQAG
jgi:hypothetical protein